jgi:hypothetical protein
MTDPAQGADLASLEPLEPLDLGATADAGMMPAAASADPLVQAMRSGLPAPGYNPYCRDKSFYRFLFAGVMLIAGSLMPFGADLARPGYTTMSGAFYLLIGIGTTWSWWASINNNRPVGLKWLLFAFVPLIGSIMSMWGFDAAAAHQRAVAAGWLKDGTLSFSADWKALFTDLGSALMKSSEAQERVGGFWRLLGVGNVIVFLGALIAEVGFLAGVVGGARKNKADTRQKQMAAAERRRK